MARWHNCGKTKEKGKSPLRLLIDSKNCNLMHEWNDLWSLKIVALKTILQHLQSSEEWLGITAFRDIIGLSRDADF